MTSTTQPRPDSAGRRNRSIQRLQEETFDLLVIGGGINGAAVARDAAMRGLRVALIEKGDFASGTSSKSSKLIHGGIRYLQQGEIRLVRVACRERDLLRRRLAPHLVQPLAFVFPVYRGDPVGFLALGAGMWLYDMLAVFRNIRAHRMLTAKRAVRAEPKLRSEGLKGAALYYDCITDDARLTLETILAAKEEGAVIVNYLGLQNFLKDRGRIVGATLADRLGGPLIEVRARCVVNATGPWADEIRSLDEPGVKPCLRLTKGVHIVVPRERVGNVNAVVMRSPRDKRVLFAIPWGSHSLIGTTDTDFHGTPDDVKADAADFDYLLESANWAFPEAHLRTEDIVSSYAGLRPLVASTDDRDPSAVSREEEIFESQSGLITLGGGKLTTHRLVAQEIVDLVGKRLGRKPETRRQDSTSAKPLPGGRTIHPEKMVRELSEANGHGLNPEQLQHLVRRYGSRTPEVMALIEVDGDLGQPLVHKMPDLWAEAVYAARVEMAVQPDDVLLRRTKVGIMEPEEAFKIVGKIEKELRDSLGEPE